MDRPAVEDRRTASAIDIFTLWYLDGPRLVGYRKRSDRVLCSCDNLHPAKVAGADYGIIEIATAHSLQLFEGGDAKNDTISPNETAEATIVDIGTNHCFSAIP
jgi:hypothetical protein